DELKDWGIAALERATEGLRAQTAVHICYGYGIKANTDWKASLGSEWRQYEESFPLLQQSSIDIISLECHNSRVPIDLVELVRGKKVMLGAIDVANEKIETAEEVAATLRRALEFVDADKLLPSTNCGMAPFPRDIALAKLSALSAGTRIVREELSDAGEPPSTKPGDGRLNVNSPASTHVGRSARRGYRRNEEPLRRWAQCCAPMSGSGWITTSARHT